MNASTFIGPLSVGIAAGVCSALLFVAGAGGPVFLTLLLFLLAPLPAFLAGLGWGPRAIIAAGAAGMATSALIEGPRLALVHLVALAAPVGLLCWMAHRRQLVAAPATSTPTTSTDRAPETDWMPAGDLLAWIAVMAGSLALLSLLMIGTDADTIQKSARTLLERQAKAWERYGGRALTALELETIISAFVRLLPVATAMSWMFMISLNFWLAGRILRTSGRLFRSWPRFAALELPGWSTIGLALSLTVAFLGSGLPALLAGGFAAAFVTAYAAGGLAVLHWISFGKSNRGLTLGAAYLSALVFAPYGTLPVAILGLLEPWLRLRNRTPGPPPLAPPSDAGPTA